MPSRISLSRRLPLGHGGLSFLLSGRGVFAFWICFGFAHAILRLNISRTLSLDDSRANELVQYFALGYQERQPPLYEWLLWCVQRVTGPEIESHLIVRYALIAAVGIACYGAVRAALKDERWAAVASLSLAASFPVGWSFHEWATQTILLCVACFATLHAAINWLERPSVRAALWLGTAIGIGLMAKFSYPLMLGGLLIACFSMKELRHRLADKRLLLSLAIALLICSPYLYWLAQVHGNVVHAVERTMINQPKPHWLRSLTGLAKLAKSLPLFLLPWLAFIVAIAPRAFGFGRASALPAGMAERLTLRTMIAAAILVAIGIVAIGATNIAERYMHAVLIIAPVYVFARVQRFDPGRLTLRPLVVLSLTVAFAVFGVRVLSTTDNVFAKRADRLSQVPFHGLALALEGQGIVRGTVVTPDVRDAGNLRSFLPGLRVLALDSFRKSNPPRRAGDETCWLIYDGMHAGEEEQALALHPTDLQRIEVNPPASGFGEPRRGLWVLGKLDPSSPVCR
ncbi:MAG TPA: glycosyltransferase family 39 protein [Xanthobacteraceae bacterium]|nr:glycosyltransferase family 39 protein [Xanthobacteraceae bacterium]